MWTYAEWEGKGRCPLNPGRGKLPLHPRHVLRTCLTGTRRAPQEVQEIHEMQERPYGATDGPP